MRKTAVILFICAALTVSAACNGNRSGMPRELPLVPSVDNFIEISESEAYAMYEAAVAGISAADSFAGHQLVFSQMSMTGLNDFENQVTVGIRQIFGEGDDVLAQIDASSTDANFISYFRNGVFYLDDGFGDSFKFTMSGDTIKDMTLSMLVTEVLFTADSILAVEAVEGSYGTAIRFEVGKTGIQQALHDLATFADTGGTFRHNEEDVTYEFNDAVVKMQLGDDGRLMDIRVSVMYKFTNHIIGEEITAYYEIGMSVSQIGGVTIDFPEYIDTFEDFDMHFEDFEDDGRF